jgi:hypothetical protein
MRRKDKEINEFQDIEEILMTGKVCHLAMADNNEPYLVTVNYGHKNNCIYFHSAPEGRKIEMIKRNPRVCFMVYTDDRIVSGENPCKDWSMKFKSVIGYGEASILKDKHEKAEGLGILMEHYSKNGPFRFSDQNLEKTAVVKIEIEEMSGKVSGGD